MTHRTLPFHSTPRIEKENDRQYYPRGGNRRSGRSTGRPRRRAEDLSTKPVNVAPKPSDRPRENVRGYDYLR